jgi:hypothetical protein
VPGGTSGVGPTPSIDETRDDQAKVPSRIILEMRSLSLKIISKDSR